MAGTLIPIFGIVFGCGIALLAIWTEYRRDRALIEKGLHQPEKPELAGPPDRGLLVSGSILGGIGIALVVSTFWFSNRQGDRDTRIYFPIYWRCTTNSLSCC